MFASERTACVCACVYLRHSNRQQQLHTHAATAHMNRRRDANTREGRCASHDCFADATRARGVRSRNEVHLNTNRVSGIFERVRALRIAADIFWRGIFMSKRITYIKHAV